MFFRFLGNLGKCVFIFFIIYEYNIFNFLFCFRGNRGCALKKVYKFNSWKGIMERFRDVFFLVFFKKN